MKILRNDTMVTCSFLLALTLFLTTGCGGSREFELNAPSSPIAGERWTLTLGGESFAFRYCPPGEYIIGSAETEQGRYDDETTARVRIDFGFWLQETEMTEAQWRALWGNHLKSSGANANLTTKSIKSARTVPVMRVTWEQCQSVIARANARCAGGQKLIFALPKEEEWEYACRAGTTTPYARATLDQCGWYDENSGMIVHEVAQKEANAWGLYDMHGNLWEWTDDPQNAQEPSKPHLLRGGSAVDPARDCRSATRSADSTGDGYDNVGLRLALVEAL